MDIRVNNGFPQTQPVGVAERLERLPEDAAREILGNLPVEEGAAVLAELPPESAAHLLEPFTEGKIAAWLRLLAANVAADLVDELPENRQRQILSALPNDKANAVAALLRYPPDSAGGKMDNRFIAVPANNTVEQCLVNLRASALQRAVDASYIYAIDEAKRLVGVISLRDLVFAPADRRVNQIMDPNVVSLRVLDDQEEIARQMQRMSLLALPVVDEHQQLVGIVKMRDALQIAQTEATEDMQLMVGLSGEERIWSPWPQSIRKRLPWLCLNLATALGGAAVVAAFEGTIARWTALAIFLPLISAVAGNAGIQALTVIIRSLALGEVTSGDALRAFRKELAIGLINGVALGMAIGLIGYGWKGSLMLGCVAGVAMLLNQILGAISGVVIPFGLRYLKIDPALASSIFVTTLTDVVGFLVFLGLAALAMRQFGL